ncbi:GcrA cell cycle regulator [Acetobacteraceae bacterium]|nr:GcrA cell cycle regulator [Acetobacteraceae bacterium]
MEWTDDVIEHLRELWAEGHSTAEIGRRLGTTKNAVVGKAHRLKLPTRPSPIKSRRKKQEAEKSNQNELFVKQVPAPKAPKPQPMPKAEKAPAPKQEAKPIVEKAVKAPAIKQEKPVEKPVFPKESGKAKNSKKATPLEAENFDDFSEAALTAEAERLRAVKRAEKAQKKEKIVPQQPKRLGLTCQWPFGDPGDADFHFCGEKIVPGRPYCLHHCERAYVRKVIK